MGCIIKKENPHEVIFCLKGSRRRCSVHLINEGVTVRNSSGISSVDIEWGLSGPSDVQPGITFMCSLDGGSEFPCKILLKPLADGKTSYP